MRWKFVDKKPKAGDWRIITKFAFFPVRTTLPTNKVVIWLERYKVNQQFREDYYGKEWRTIQISYYEYWS